jgi:hypothetical protein
VRKNTPDAKASTASPAQRIVTIAKRPSCGPGWCNKCHDFHFWKSEILFIPGLDTISDNQK